MALGPGQWTVIQALKLTPKNLVSRMAGHVASVSLPGPLRRAQIKSFGRTFGVNFDEVKEPLESFHSVQDFFTRELKDGARPVDAATDAFVSPCDGAWGESGIVEDGMVLQVKGRPYRLAELLGDEEEARRYEGGAFATLYLSPKDYHRFHSPADLEVKAARYLPGTLWPVNRAGVEGVERLFAQNERIVAICDVTQGSAHGRLALVPVGATMVGKVRVTFDDLTTNVRGVGREDRDYSSAPHRLAKGQEWGRFEFGSTIVFAAEKGLLTLDAQPLGTPLKLGTRIGTIHTMA